MAEKNLLNSIERIYDLYIYLLLSFPVVREVALNKQDEEKEAQTYKEDLYPNLKFVTKNYISDYRFFDLSQLSENRKINWDNDEKREYIEKSLLK